MTVAIKFLHRLLALLPLPWVHALGGFIGRGFVYIPNKRLSTTRTNLSLCFPELSEQERQQLARTSFMETGKGVFETSAMWLWPRERILSLVKQVSGEEHIQAGMKRGKGIILAAPHLGAWEIIGLYCPPRYPMTILYKPPPMEGMDQLMRASRERTGATLAPTDRTGIKALYQALDRGEIVGILPDQDPAGGAGVFTPFFGRSANTMVLLSRLAARSQAAVILAYAERLPRGHGYHLHFIPGSKAINDPDLTTSATAVNALVEQGVRTLPEQYLWCYKRFRTRPAGESKLYKK
ncbi:MAG: lysophospholipid acyltransferase [Gammaproteobacteria bacterium]|nr:MAG: lysophospholipid acyltransferase [Gammaproteobacteria bacterium]